MSVPVTLSDRVARAASDAVSDAIGAHMRPALIRAGLGERQAREFIWRPATTFGDEAGWAVGGPGRVALQAQVEAGCGYDEVRELVGEVAHRCGDVPVRQVGIVPADEMATIEADVVIEGVPVTVWGVVDHRDRDTPLPDRAT